MIKYNDEYIYILINVYYKCNSDIDIDYGIAFNEVIHILNKDLL